MSDEAVEHSPCLVSRCDDLTKVGTIQEAVRQRW